MFSPVVVIILTQRHCVCAGGYTQQSLPEVLAGGGGGGEGGPSEDAPPYSVPPPPHYEADSSEYHSLDPHQSPYMESSPELYSGHPPPVFEHKYHLSQYPKTYPHPRPGKLPHLLLVK